MGGGSAPDPDPNIGIAALKSAELGENYFDWMRQRARTTDRWATKDRARFESTFLPLQDQYIAEAKNYDSPAAQRAAAREARATTAQQIQVSQDASERAMAAVGIDPTSRRATAGRRGFAIDSALAKAGAENMARRDLRSRGIDMLGQAVNLGQGSAVNPLSSYQAGSQAASSGFQGAMQGYNQQGNLLAQQDQQRMQAWQAGQDSQGALFGAAGTLAGMTSGSWMPMLAMASDEDGKTKRRKAHGFIDAVDSMDVDAWRYKAGAPGGDDGAADHVGPMAQDFQKATGLGDGKTIPVVDAIGVVTGAVKELSAEVRALKAAPKRRRVARGMAEAA